MEAEFVEADRPVPDCRVALELVAADTDDPFLTVRVDPDPGAPIVEKLPPQYAGLHSTGLAVTLQDGSVWVAGVDR